MKTVLDFLRRHALVILSALVVLSIPAGAAFGKYAQSVTVTDTLNLSVEMKTYTLMRGNTFKSTIETYCWDVQKIKFCNASVVKEELGDNIEFYKCKDKNGNAVTVNEDGSGNIYLYYNYNSTTRTAYVAPETDGTIYANENCSEMFYAYGNSKSACPYTQLEEICFDNFNTSRVTDMSKMFNFHVTFSKMAPKMEQLDLSGFDTSNVTTMASMFSGQSELTSLDLSSFDTAHVTDMSGMFSNCYKLTNITLGDKFDTSNVTTMSGMFSSCINLTYVDGLANFNTRNVTDMSSMFKATGFTSLDLRSFDTSKVTTMSDMFEGSWFDNRDVYKYNMSYSSKLKSVDLSNFNTSSVTTMANMFRKCTNITELDLSSFNTEKVANMSEMFEYADNLRCIIATDKFDVRNVTDSSYMFHFNVTERLKGGSGTPYWGINPKDKTYARIDDPPANPGYFTAAPGTSTTSTFSATGTDAAANGFGLAFDLAS